MAQSDQTTDYKSVAHVHTSFSVVNRDIIFNIYEHNGPKGYQTFSQPPMFMTAQKGMS